jgi:LacI family transcriptional regulator
MPHVTLKEVADHVGVNVATASRALSLDKNSLVSATTRRRVLEAAETLGYRGNQQASALRRGRTGIIGVIVADISNPFIGPVLRGIAGGLGGQGLLPIMTETRDSSEDLARICDRLLAQRVDGIICAAGRQSDQAVLKRLAKEIPTVLTVRQWPNSGITTVSADDVLGGRFAAEHLLGLGHTRVAQLVGPQDIGSFAGRTQGFSRAIADAGAESIIVDDVIRLPTLDAGQLLMETLLEQTGSNRPTAVFAQNDSIAIGAMHLAFKRGFRCPDNISIVGYNDVPLTAHLTPALTTVKLPAYEMGRLAAQLVATLIEDPEQSAHTVTLAPELIIRQSTRAL